MRTLSVKGFRLANELKVEYERIRLRRHVKFEDVYNSFDELLNELSQINIVKDANCYPYKGYEYIHSFAGYVKKGYTLSKKQITTCKKLATEIHIAYTIRDCWL